MYKSRATALPSSTLCPCPGTSRSMPAAAPTFGLAEAAGITASQTSFFLKLLRPGWNKNVQEILTFSRTAFYFVNWNRVNLACNVNSSFWNCWEDFPVLCEDEISPSVWKQYFFPFQLQWLKLSLNLQFSRWVTGYSEINSLKSGESKGFAVLQRVLFAGVEDVNLGYLEQS